MDKCSESNFQLQKNTSASSPRRRIVGTINGIGIFFSFLARLKSWLSESNGIFSRLPWRSPELLDLRRPPRNGSRPRISNLGSKPCSDKGVKGGWPGRQALLRHRSGSSDRRNPVAAQSDTDRMVSPARGNLDNKINKTERDSQTRRKNWWQLGAGQGRGTGWNRRRDREAQIGGHTSVTGKSVSHRKDSP